VETAARCALPALKRGGAIIVVQNGVNVISTLKAFLPAHRITVGPGYVVARLISPTAVTYGGLARIFGRF
jgi:ketopantoate reductase